MRSYLNILYTNADSLRNKLNELISIANTKNLDIMCITETLPKTNRTLDQCNIFPITNYTYYESTTGRGIAIYVHERLKSQLLTIDSDFNDQLWVNVELSANHNVTIGGIYRSPNSSPLNNDNLLKLFDVISKSRGRDLIIMGDFNYKEVDWRQMTVKTKASHPANQLFEKINDLFLEQMVLEPTRYRPGQTANTLDWILTNYPEKIDNLQIQAPLGQNGDHNTISFTYDTPDLAPPSSVTALNYSKGKYSLIAKALEMIKWDGIFDQKNVEGSWQAFLDIIDKLMREHIPKKGEKKCKSQPWVDHEVKTALKEKNRAWKTYKNNKSEQLWTNFKSIRNSTNRLIKRKKLAYEHSLANDIKLNPKKFWNYLNLKRNSNRDFPTMVDSEGRKYYSDLDKAGQFNNYFSEVFTSEPATNIPNLPNKAGLNKMTDIIIDEGVVAKELKKVDISKSAGPDLIHSRVIYELRDHIAYPLSKIFQYSLNEGSLPSIWKLANVKPIHKKGKKNTFSNYRPISLTSVCSKLMERIIRDQLVRYLESNNLINEHQHGFRAGRSCTTQLLEVMEIWTEIIDKGGSIDCVYLDFAKAFDKVPHKRLIEKLKAYGIEGKIVNWISDFLHNRQQVVQINNAKSTPSKVKSGIPQGSVLGPILFIIFINDLPDTIESSLKIFADDTKIFRIVESLADKEKFEKDLTRLMEWSNKWLLPFNLDKCKVTHLGSQNQKFNYIMGQFNLETIASEKDLGVLFDDNLKFCPHMKQIIAKANSRLGLIRNTFTELPAKTLLPLYKTLVRPILEYAMVIWKPFLKKDIDDVEKVQRRATKLVRSIKDLPYPDRLKSLKLDSLQFRRRRNDVLQVFRIVKNFDNINTDSFFKFQTYGSTRGHELKLVKPRAKSNIRLYSFSHRVINDWNGLKDETIKSKTLNSFKNALEKEWKNHPEKYFKRN